MKTTISIYHDPDAGNVIYCLHEAQTYDGPVPVPEVGDTFGAAYGDRAEVAWFKVTARYITYLKDAISVVLVTKDGDNEPTPNELAPPPPELQ